MSFILNGVDISNLVVNGIQIDDAYLNGVKVYQRIAIGVVLDDGGIVFALDGGDWLVCAPATMRAVRKWGLYGTDTSLPNDPNPDPNTGEYNTDVLTSGTYNSINDGQGSVGAPAAEYARSNGYDLPNRQELQTVYNNRAAIDAADTSGGGATLSAIGAGTAPGSVTPVAWTSTEYLSDSAGVIALDNGGITSSGKAADQWVVPVRRIPV